MFRFAACSRRVRLPLVIAAMALSLSACTNFIYDRLDTLAAWYIQRLVSLDDDQRSDLRSSLESTLQWHREAELARYAKLLRELADTTARPGDPVLYRSVGAQIEEFGSRLVERAAPEAARLLLKLNPAQLTELETNLAERSGKRNARDLKALAQGTWHERRARDIEKQLKRWTGAVTREQQSMIAQQSRRFEPTTEEWLESQARWREALFAALRARFDSSLSPSDVEERILALLRKPDSQWTDAYRSKAARNREQSLAALAALDASLTPAQRSHLQRELTRLAQQLVALAQR
jgi:hypothetical protein